MDICNHCYLILGLKLLSFGPFQKNMNPGTQRKKSKAPGPRVLLDYFMSLLMLFFGVFIIWSEKIIGYDYFKDSSLVSGSMKWVIGILFMLYGVFRAYRGYLLDQRDKLPSQRED